MSVPAGFQFSQGSLQDFVDCRRRFQLKYLERLDWPALQTEPAMQSEIYMRKGALFHHMVHQHLLGITSAQLENLIQDDELAVWWRNYLNFSEEHIFVSESRGLFPEISLSAPLGGFRLLAKYDLLKAKDDGRFTIFDWKTSRNRPGREWLKERMQTRVYPYLFVRAGEQFNAGEAILPEMVEMIYWFANYPDQPERFSYTAGKFEEDNASLERLVTEIDRLSDNEFPLTTRQELCAYCVYRSLCDRGVRAGPMEGIEGELEVEETLEIFIDFEQVPEIEF